MKQHTTRREILSTIVVAAGATSVNASQATTFLFCFPRGASPEPASRVRKNLQRSPCPSRTINAGKADCGIVADHLRAAGYEVTTGVGKTGVVGLLRNGTGPTVMLRADMDALPVQEATGLPYASQATATDNTGQTVPVMHACGHDMHVTWLIGGTKVMAKARESRKGTLLAVFQPGEETAEGAQTMIKDGLLQKFPKPAVVLGQHALWCHHVGRR